MTDQTTAVSDEAELIPRPQVGQVWRPRRGGMWRTVIALHPAGVEWTASPGVQAFSRWENWDQWIRAAGAFADVQQSVPEVSKNFQGLHREENDMADELASIAAPIYTWMLTHMPPETIIDEARLDEVAELAIKHAHRILLAARRFTR